MIAADDNDDGWETVAPRRKPRKLRDNASSGRPSYDSFMILLVGLPGSGKSSFAQTLIVGDPSGTFVRICQDVLKSRKKCESACRRALGNGKIAVIDRCNFDEEQRENFISIAAEFNVPVDCIVFKYSVKTCILRCENRADHETIESHQAQSVVKRMARMFKPPTLDEFCYAPYRLVSEVSHFHEADAIASKYLQGNFKFNSNAG